MNRPARQTYVEPTEEAGCAFFSRPIIGSIVMLNLMRFRDTADHRGARDLAPATPISGQAAYQLYVEQTLPMLQRTGGEFGDYLPRALADKDTAGTLQLKERHELESLVRANSQPARSSPTNGVC